MLTIRFARVGKKGKPQYRIVLQERTATPTGRHVDVLGSYDPHAKKSVLKVEKIKDWIAKGAQPSDTAHNLFVREGIIEAKKRTVKMERPKTPEAPVEEVKSEEAPAEETKTE